MDRKKVSAMGKFILPIAFLILSVSPARSGGLLPDTVVEFTPGTGAGFGALFFPQNVLTGPDGGLNPPNEPSDSESNLLSLGNGGSILLEWSGDVIIDGPGADFTVFENTLLTIDTGIPFIEAGIIEVGQTPDSMVRIPYRFIPPNGWEASTPYLIPFFESNYEGLAGTRPTLVNPTNGIDPADPTQSGGNAFDLATVGLAWARYVRIIDPGTPGQPGALTGMNGLAIYDTQLSPNGFDLDTAIAIHSGPEPTTSSVSQAWSLYE